MSISAHILAQIRAANPYDPHRFAGDPPRRNRFKGSRAKTALTAYATEVLDDYDLEHLDNNDLAALVTKLLRDLRHVCDTTNTDSRGGKLDFTAIFGDSTETYWRDIDAAHAVADPPKYPYTVTVAGGERHDGEKPFSYMLYAIDRDAAIATVLVHHAHEQDDTDLEIVEPDTYAGPAPDYFNANDYRSHT